MAISSRQWLLIMGDTLVQKKALIGSTTSILHCQKQEKRRKKDLAPNTWSLVPQIIIVEGRVLGFALVLRRRDLSFKSDRGP